MIFLHAVKLGGIWTVLLLPNGEASHLRAEEHSSGRRGTADLHLRIASDAPVRSAVNTLDCVLGESDKAIKRNSLVNSEPRNAKMMDADVLMAQEAQELRNEAKLHEHLARELEDIKRTQKRRSDSSMKDIQEGDQAEISKLKHKLELLREAASSTKKGLDEEKYLIREAHTHDETSKAVRLQQQNSKHKSRDEVAALIQYPLLGFTLPSSVNPNEYLTKYSATAAVSPSVGSRTRSARAPPACSSRGKAGRTTRQRLRDRIEILGDEAALEEVEKEKEARAMNAKQHLEKGKEPCKGKCNAKGRLEDKRAHKEAREENRESTPATTLHEFKGVVALPFQQGDAPAVFSESSEDAEMSQDNFEGEIDDLDEQEAALASAFSANKGEQDDDNNETGEPFGSAKFNSMKTASAKRKKKVNGSEESEQQDDQNQQDGGEKQEKKASHNSGAKENPESAGSIEATEQEAEQAKNLQQAQGMPPQQSFHQVNSRYGANGTRLSNPHHSNEIHTAIEAARLRLTPPRKTIVTTSLLDQEGFAGDPGTSEFINDEEKRTDNSELAGTPNTEGTASREEALATDEVEAAGEISAAEKEAARAQASLKEENRLLAAAEEAEQAQRALKICAQGSFLSCRQGQIRRPIEEPHARVISGISRKSRHFPSTGSARFSLRGKGIVKEPRTNGSSTLVG